MVHVALVLSGCGFEDGSEIHEAVLALAALDAAGAGVTVAAPDLEFEVIDHARGKPTGERRNCLVEAARIARGRIVDLAGLKPEDFDALVLPGGFGAAKSLCDFASAQAKTKVNPDLARFALALHDARKPIGAICISPAIVAALLRDRGLSARLTLGDDASMSAALRAMGQQAVDCPVDQCVVDKQLRIVCTPAYMYDARIADVARGIGRMVDELLALVD
jgi:enhancing lycopene biosynthesis protein 2